MGQYQQGTFFGEGETELYYQSWFPSVPPRAILVIIHGLGGHSGLFNNIIDHLVAENYGVFAYDLRGHGRSQGQRGYIKNWAEFRGDLQAFLSLIRQQYSHCSCFLWGHSLGGIIVLDYVMRYPEQVQGAIIVAAPLGEVGVSPIKVLIGKILSRFWPSFTLDTGIELEAGSRDAKVLDAYLNDPLRHTQATARLANEFFLTVAWIKSHIYQLKIPLLFLQGGADRISFADGVRLFFEQVSWQDKQLIIYPQAYHELHNDLNYLEVIKDLIFWLDKHLCA